MRRLAIVFILLGFFASAAHAQPGRPEQVRILTELGDILVEVYPERAPITAANFLQYVDSRLYDGGSFFRTVREDNQPNDSVRIAVIQALGHPWKELTASRAPVPLERTSRTGLRHRDGTLSMARAEPNSATSSFFICIGNQPELDFGGRRNPDGQGFAAFGQVIDGMDVVRRIQSTRADGQAIMPPVRILSMVRTAEGTSRRE